MRINLADIRKIEQIEDRNEKVFQAALYYAKQGIPLIPLPVNEKHPDSKAIYTSRCSARESKIREWFNPKTGRYRGWNIGFGCGDYFGKGGVFAIDVDAKYSDRYGNDLWGPAAWERLTSENGPLEGPVQRTPSGGLHILTAWQENLVPTQNRLGLGIDTRGGHAGKISSHIVVFPSIVNGAEYRWECSGEIESAPPWLVETMGVSWKSSRRGEGGRGNEGMGEADIEQKVPADKIRRFLDALNPDDLDYSQWVKVGQAIQSQYPGEDGLELWDEWSKRGERYEPGECHSRWGGFNANGPVRIATLIYYVQEFGDVSKIEPDEGGDEETFVADCVDEYNRRYALVLTGEQAKIIRKEQVPDSLQDRYKQYSIDAFRAFKCNDVVLVPDDKSAGMKPVRKMDIWMSSPRRNSFDGLVMHPAKPRVVEDVYGHRFLNTWAGFAVKPEPGDWSLMKKHILDNLCSGNEDHYNWLMDWIADMFQEPADPKGTAVILGGIEGAGKGTLANAIAHIFGIHASVVSNAKHLSSQFNDMLMDSVFLFADEVVYAGNHEVANMLKAMVTEKKNTREAKFGAKQMVDQFLRIMMATNNDWKIAAGKDSRRWFVLQVSSSTANNHEYFVAIQDQMNNGGYEAMLHELLNRTVVSNLRWAPVTQELKTQRTMMQVQSLYDSLPAWVAYVVDTGDLGVQDMSAEMDSEPEWPLIVSKSGLWDSYAEWARKYKPRANILATNIFYQKLQTLGFDEGSRLRKGSDRVRTVKVPPFEVLVANAEKEMAIYSTNKDREEM